MTGQGWLRRACFDRMKFCSKRRIPKPSSRLFILSGRPADQHRPQFAQRGFLELPARRHYSCPDRETSVEDRPGGYWMQYPTKDDDLANMISLLLGRAINSCFGNDSHVLPVPEWRSLREQVDEWKRDLPASFEPIQLEQDYNANNFPELLHFHGWHIAGLQYYHILEIILLLAELGSAVTAEAGSLKMGIAESGFRIMALTPRVVQRIEYHAVQICALAISNDSNAARVNAFGPIAFCGVYIRNPQQRRQLLDELQKWEKLTSWPVESIVRVLKTAWEEETVPFESDY
ncbi:hypothetical protein VTN77DRAFT_3892 [Rasamsonia byssochlamydoides]|uniref:uncharacterized protein n=1 Tax=Rasamsonia byssochlamydoides TaxID=89139 RepID=UPI00374230E7